jgi:GDP-L-fucose synthase
MVGSAIVRALQKQGYENLVLRSRKELDLVEQVAVRDFFHSERPDFVVVAAARVGGIHANNTYPADFIYENLMLESNLIHQAHKADINGLLFLGSSCIYPKLAAQPMQESALLSAPLEPTNEPYAIAKIAGIKLCESYNRQHGRDYRSLMPTNLYGPGDNFDLDNSHVIPALMRKFHEAKMSKKPAVEIWGSGNAKREFLHVDDLAAACLHIMTLERTRYQANATPMLSHINVGTGEDVTISELAHLVQRIVGHEGEIQFDVTRPDGAPRKLLNIAKLRSLGWRPTIDIDRGLRETYAWYCENVGHLRC